MPAKKPTTVDAYLAALSDERRELVEAILDTIRDNADKKLEQGMQYGMPAFFVPHEHYPGGYHCKPEEPLPYASVASGKAAVSIHLFCAYCDEAEKQRFVEAWKKTGNRLDMGKSCVRVKKLEQVPLDVVGKTVKCMTVSKFIKAYEKNVPAAAKRKAKK